MYQRCTGLLDYKDRFGMTCMFMHAPMDIAHDISPPSGSRVQLNEWVISVTTDIDTRISGATRDLLVDLNFELPQVYFMIFYIEKHMKCSHCPRDIYTVAGSSAIQTRRFSKRHC